MNDTYLAATHGGVALVLLLVAVGFLPSVVGVLAALVGAGAAGLKAYNMMWR